MREKNFFKIIISIILCAGTALFYAHQEVEIVKVSFLINENRHEVTFLLDQYRSLVYNLSRLESPKRIEDTLCVNEIVLCMPRVENIRQFEEIVLARKKNEKQAKTHRSFLSNALDLFSTKAEAKDKL